jgi:hypothetical protein
MKTLQGSEGIAPPIHISPTRSVCIERIVLLDFIHRLVSQEQTKLRNWNMHKILQYTRPQKITQGSITNHRATYLGAYKHKP